MGANSKQPQPNNLPKFYVRSKVRKKLDTTINECHSYLQSAAEVGAVAPSTITEDFDRENGDLYYFSISQPQTIISELKRKLSLHYIQKIVGCV
jgi:hypothetical protein